ncbi:hypothetical protein [Acidipila rosea]|uniref:Glycogen debranching enzyme n=1 Tax=Acidipila rosea TaxID=768535 RepID=A0A4R1LGP5_9BACT|nr:hypothetical protein [Acidipila rosea]TCK76033.1 glycogen debranching enzyme [Acidipila rosea]
MKLCFKNILMGLLFCLVTGFVRLAQAQTNEVSSPASLTVSTDAVAARFVAVHGQHALVMGYPATGLEFWAYPLQLVSEYRVSFKPRGATSDVDGTLLLRRIEYRPHEVTRIYVGPDFVVREKLFIPLDAEGALVSYEVEGRGAVDINVHFKPVLNLMWPGAIGGQNTQWSDAVSGYLISEPTGRFSAVIASPQIIAHDETVNSTVRARSGLSFTLRPRSNPGAPMRAVVLVASNPATAEKMLKSDMGTLEAQAEGRYAKVAADALQIETLDADVNRALAWAEVALEQAWVCNPQLGCGIVAGYGPSRDARRPQYAWFFAGDGLVATDALVAAGEYARAQRELAFILQYRELKTGMIWHELSQSAGLMDWSKYPYMYVHVDITFQFLSSLANYVAASRDVDFARHHWPAIEKAYQYCLSTVSASTGLPQIPEGKEGSDEQNRMKDDIDLSAAWLGASSAYSQLAQWTGHPQEAERAEAVSEKAGKEMAARYWDNAQRFWIGGHAVSGREVVDLRSRPAELIHRHVFTAQQDDELLDQLASDAYQTDWGSRGMSAASDHYDPDSYSSGSVSALGTASLAMAFWQEHRPATAFQIWSALLSWNSLDAPGHMHEVLAGDYFHQQTESVPEQTWSSAGFLDAAVHGLLGLQVESMSNRILFAPHLPGSWNGVTVKNIMLPHGRLSLKMTRSANGMDLAVVNDGSAVDLVFDPTIPIGAQVLGAKAGNRSVEVTPQRNEQDEHARMEFTMQHGTEVIHLRYRGGVDVMAAPVRTLVGEASHGVKIVGVKESGNVLTIDADVPSAAPANSSLEIDTKLRIGRVEGGELRSVSSGRYELILQGKEQAVDALGYARVHARLELLR